MQLHMKQQLSPQWWQAPQNTGLWGLVCGNHACGQPLRHPPLPVLLLSSQVGSHQGRGQCGTGALTWPPTVAARVFSICRSCWLGSIYWWAIADLPTFLAGGI